MRQAKPDAKSILLVLEAALDELAALDATDQRMTEAKVLLARSIHVLRQLP